MSTNEGLCPHTQIKARQPFSTSHTFSWSLYQWYTRGQTIVGVLVRTPIITKIYSFDLWLHFIGFLMSTHSSALRSDNDGSVDITPYISTISFSLSVSPVSSYTLTRAAGPVSPGRGKFSETAGVSTDVEAAPDKKKCQCLVLVTHPLLGAS